MHLHIRNANVITMDSDQPRASDVVVLAGQIVAVGNASEVGGMSALEASVPGMVTIDAGGRTLIPGFVETHTHPLMTGLAQSSTVDCGTPPNRTIDDVLARLADAVAKAAPGEPIRGRTYDDSMVAENRNLTKQDLDRVSPDNPVLVLHISGHLTYVNSRALADCGIQAEMPDPEGGLIERDDSGEATGVLFENAARLVAGLAARPDVEEMVGARGWASGRLVQAGVTSFHDAGSFPFAKSFRAYQEAAARGVLKPRAYVAAAFTGLAAQHGAEEVVPRLEAAGMRSGFGSERVKMGILKMWQDGSIQGYSGALSCPYHDSPEATGMTLMPQGTFDAVVAQAAEAGIQVGTHGNGDRAIDSILDAYEAGLAAHPGLDHRFRIEHCQAVRDDQLDRMAEMGVLASFFNLHVYYWGARHRDRFLGPERGPRISPLRLAKDRGIVFGCHSDWWVTPVDPLMNMQVAVNRQTREGDPLGLELTLTPEEALRSMTIDSAFLGFEETTKGSIEVGKLGDLVLLSDDPLTVAPDQIESIEVDATVVGGEVVYDRRRDGGSHRDERLARDPYREEAYL